MALNIPLFKVLAPEFSEETKKTLDLITPVAERQVPIGKWGDKTEEAVIYLVAHMLKMSQRNGRVGGVTASTTASLSRSYGGLSTIKGSLDLTSYGVEFQRIRKQLVITPIVV